MIEKENFISALQELRKSEKRGFDQTVDLIINLRGFDLKRNSLNVLVNMPYVFKKRKICAFLEKQTKVFDYVITKDQFDAVQPKDIKKIAKDYDLFVSAAKLMPELAKRFGRILGSLGKMPDPKAGCVVMVEDDVQMKKLAERLSQITKIRAKEASVKVAIGKESMSDEQLNENAAVVHDTILKALPNGKENVKSVMLKLTMSKPIKIVAKIIAKAEKKEKK